MKRLKLLIISIAILIILFFSGISVYISFYAKDLIEDTLTSALERKVDLEKVSYRFPLGLRVQNMQIARSLEVGNFFEAKDIIAHLSLDAFYRRQLVFDSVTFIQPLVVFEKTKKTGDTSDELLRRQGIVIPPGQSDLSIQKSISGEEKNIRKSKSKVFIKRLVLKQGVFQYTNSSIDKDFSFTMEDVYLKAEQLAFPVTSGRTDFNLSGRLVKKGNPLSGSSVEGFGWVDIVNRDMEAKVEVVEADGSVGMTAEAVSKNNDMKVTGEVKFQNILMGAKREDSSDASAVNDLISNVLSSAGIEIGAKFSFKTKMDDFRPEQVSFSGSVVTK